MASFKIKSFSFNTLFKLSGNSTVNVLLQSDSTGESGHPTSERDFALISTFSPYLIAMSNWLIFGVSALLTSSICQVYWFVAELYDLFLASVLNSCQFEKAPVLFLPLFDQ